VRLAAQVQARTQQLAATKGQSKNLLVSAHGLNLAAARKRKQDVACELTYSGQASVVNMSYPPTLLTTQRTRLRAFCARDIELLVDLDSDPEVMRYISKGKATPRGVMEEKVLPQWLGLYRNPRPYGFWAVDLLGRGSFIGWVHLRADRISPLELELGYRLIRAVWDQGLATECSRALIAMAFEERLCDFICARTFKTNIASQRVMQKCGLALCEEFVYSNEVLPDWTEAERSAVKYGISRQHGTALVRAIFQPVVIRVTHCKKTRME
jgi:RimJ/RimL family protein N-acetyltransferase